jgi:cellulose biosynthesis protein BcsQ
MERSVALASDEVIAVMLPETFSVLGFQIFTRFLDEVNQAYRADTYNRIVVVNRVNLGINAHKGNVAEAQERLTTREVFTVPQDVNIEKAQDGGVMLWDINRYSRAIEAYREIAGRLINA